MFGGSDFTEVTRRQQAKELFYDSFWAPFQIALADWRTVVGLFILSLFTLIALLTWAHMAGYEILNAILGALGSPWRLEQPSAILSADPEARATIGLHPFENWKHPLGTDPTGRGLLRAVFWSTPAMLQMIIAGGVFTTAMAAVVGTVSGYKGGVVESVLMTLADIAMSIPGLPLVIVLIAVVDPSSPILLGILITVNVWAGLSRTIHSQVLSLREQSYVEASRTMGIRSPRIIQKDILPNLMPYIMVNFVYAARRVIYDSVALYFLGFLPVDTPTNWGVMMNWGYSQFGALSVPSNRYMILVPMVPIVLLSLGLILLSQGTDRLFNPRVRTRHEGETVEDEGEDDDGRVDAPMV